MSDKRTKRTDKRTESAMKEWKALIAEAKGDDWDSRDVLLAADRVVRAARRYNNACGTVPGGHTPDPEALSKAHVELCRAVDAMEREGR